MTHEIKLSEQFCDAVLEGRKTFEIRKNDRGYQTGDYIKFLPVEDGCSLHYVEHPLKDKIYKITYILSSWGIPQDYVIFSIKEVSDSTKEPW